MNAPAVAAAITSAIERSPVAASTPAAIAVVSLGTSGKKASTAAIASTNAYVHGEPETRSARDSKLKLIATCPRQKSLFSRAFHLLQRTSCLHTAHTGRAAPEGSHPSRGAANRPRTPIGFCALASPSPRAPPDRPPRPRHGALAALGAAHAPARGHVGLVGERAADRLRGRPRRREVAAAVAACGRLGGDGSAAGSCGRGDAEGGLRAAPAAGRRSDRDRAGGDPGRLLVPLRPRDHRLRGGRRSGDGAPASALAAPRARRARRLLP